MHLRRRLLASAFALLAIPLSASAASAAVASPAHPATHHAPVVVRLAPSKFGPVLVTGAGRALYTFSGDGIPFSPTGPQFNCTALNTAPALNNTPCTVAWPPLQATGRLIAGRGVRQRGLGTVTRNGVKQVTYFGQPLYRFIKDTAARQMNGEDVAAFSGTWYLDTPSGRPAVGRATVMTQASPNGVILSAQTAGAFHSLYTLTADGPRTTTCVGPCAAAWPPLLTSRHAVAAHGARRGLVGTIRRPDGTFQVTYRGRPVYFFAFDLGAGAPNGQTNGEDLIDPLVDGNWYNLRVNGAIEPGPATIGSETTSLGSDLSVTAGLTQVTATLYAFSADSAHASRCTGLCARIWIPVLTSKQPSAAAGADGSKLGTISRHDGTFQVTYNGQPLYFFAKDLSAGTSGNGITAFGGTFRVVNTDGTVG
jgi:predicted lipoprotein with Yx(FWY)xxD motif